MKENFEKQLDLIEIYAKEIEENYAENMFDISFWTNEICEVIKYLRKLGEETFKMIKKEE